MTTTDNNKTLLYLQSIFDSNRSIFEPWPLMQIIRDRYKWDTDRRLLHLRLNASHRVPVAKARNDSKTVTTKFDCIAGASQEQITQVQTVEPKRKRSRATRQLSSAPRQLTHVVEPISYMVCPPLRNWSVSEVVHHCEAQRGKRRRQTAMEQTATALGVQYWEKNE